MVDLHDTFSIGLPLHRLNGQKRPGVLQKYTGGNPLHFGSLKKYVFPSDMVNNYEKLREN